MKERPINMRAEEVRAILAGRKTQFRRVIREVPTYKHLGRSIMDWSLSGVYTDQHGNHWLDVQTDVDDYSHNELKCPFGAPGDRLWVRECWADISGMGFDSHLFPRKDLRQVAYRADCSSAGSFRLAREYGVVWASSVHMPRKFSRITLEVVSVRVQRLQGISEEDAIAEGVGKPVGGVFFNYLTPTPLPTGRESYRTLWQSIHGPRSWDENPWVWAVEFRRLEGAQ